MDRKMQAVADAYMFRSAPAQEAVGTFMRKHSARVAG